MTRGPYVKARARRAEETSAKIKRVQVSVLRNEGKSWQEIADHLGISAATARRLYQAAQAEVQELSLARREELTQQPAPQGPDSLAGKALLLKEQGLTYVEIGQKLGISREWARQLVQEELDRLLGEELRSIEHLKKLQHERYERLLAGQFEAAQKGDPDAMRAVLKILEAENNLLGLNAPKKVDIEEEVKVLALQVGIDPEELTEAARELIREFARRN